MLFKWFSVEMVDFGVFVSVVWAIFGVFEVLGVVFW
jgi:hypothetical protein